MNSSKPSASAAVPAALRSAEFAETPPTTATGVRAVAIVGGVSANSALRNAAGAAAEADGFEVFIPRPVYSVDNAAMIAVTGHFKWAAGVESPLTLSAEPSLAV